MMTTTMIPAVQQHPVYAFAWRRDRAVCELYAMDLEALANVRSSHVDEAGLPVEATIRAIWNEVSRLSADDSSRGQTALRPRGHSIMVAIDGRTGAIVERWFALDPWSLVAGRLGRAA